MAAIGEAKSPPTFRGIGSAAIAGRERFSPVRDLLEA